MWKFVSRRIRDTFEKGLNHFEKRSSAGVVSTNSPCDDKKRSSSPCLWFCPKNCWSSQSNNNDTNNRKWSENINLSWRGAITWSSALVLGWYASQIINLAYKYHGKEQKCKTNLNNLIIRLRPYANGVNREALCINTNSRIKSIINNVVPTVHLVSNELNTEKRNENSSSSTDITSSSTTSSDLGDVLNSIENKLGLAAIENGQHQDGLNLLRSAATRHYAPALYNLGLCYEMGLGVTVDEKTAMEFYRSAAALEHPGALYNLGIYYGQGRGGLQRNSDTAARLLRLAAVQGQQDAIKALKALNLDIVEPPLDKETKKWTFSPNDNIVPTQTTLFVENVHFLNTKNVY